MSTENEDALKAQNLIIAIFNEFRTHHKLHLDVNVIEDVANEILVDSLKTQVKKYLELLKPHQLLAVLDEIDKLKADSTKKVRQSKKTKGIH